MLTSNKSVPVWKNASNSSFNNWEHCGILPLKADARNLSSKCSNMVNFDSVFLRMKTFEKYDYVLK